MFAGAKPLFKRPKSFMSSENLSSAITTSSTSAMESFMTKRRSKTPEVSQNKHQLEEDEKQTEQSKEEKTSILKIFFTYCFCIY